MGKYRDLRNQSRDFKTCGNQSLIDLRLNAFGLELFVESYWDTIEEMITKGEIPKDKEPGLVLEFTYRGMSVRLDPEPGLTEWDRPNPAPSAEAGE